MKILIYVLTLLIAIVLYITYDKISQPEMDNTIHISEEKTQPPKTENDVIGFLFKKLKKVELPARELYMKIDFRKYRTVVIYKITINANDRYAVFNIKAILENEGVAYSMLETNKTQIYVLFSSLQQAERIIKIFRNYKFKIDIEKIVKRI